MSPTSEHYAMMFSLHHHAERSAASLSLSPSHRSFTLCHVQMELFDAKKKKTPHNTYELYSNEQGFLESCLKEIKLCTMQIKSSPAYFNDGNLQYLAPKQFADTNENTPEPLIQGESCAGERLPSKLHDDDLKTNENMSTKDL